MNKFSATANQFITWQCLSKCRIKSIFCAAALGIDHSPDSGRHAADASADCLLKAILLSKLLQFS
jgi:hypothetical protein